MIARVYVALLDLAGYDGMPLGSLLDLEVHEVGTYWDGFAMLRFSAVPGYRPEDIQRAWSPCCVGAWAVEPVDLWGRACSLAKRPEKFAWRTTTTCATCHETEGKTGGGGYGE